MASSSSPSPAPPLTRREAEVLALIREHLTNAEIGQRLYLSIRTVETHVSALLRKFAVTDRRALARQAAGADPPRGARSSLPRPLTSFIGRTAELQGLADAVRSHRLVTASGPSGVGKTRLAIEVADELAGETADGVVFVDLVKITDPQLVASAIADALDISDASVTSREDVLLAAIKDRDGLVVMDNCEHVRDAARTWIERLLEAAPALHVLATSRVRLMLPFEHVVAVPGLSHDDDDWDEASALFVTRMVAAGAGEPSGASELATIREICSALDGSALGIELAAARVPSLGLTALAEALAARLEVLVIGSRADDRHGSLRSAIDWTYELLGPDEQPLLLALARFAAPADLAALGFVSGLTPPAVITAIGGLVDWNLASRHETTPPRFRVLETVRQYAVEAAEKSRTSERLRAAHLRWCTTRLSELRTVPDSDWAWCNSVDSMLDDARLALADGLTHDPPEIVAGATELLADVLFERGHPGEAQQRYEAAAVLSSDAAEKCRLLRLAAGAAAGRNVGGESVDLLIRAAGVARAAGDRSGAARDLAAAAALQFRAGGIMRRLVETAIVDDLLDQAGALSSGDAHAEAAIAVARGWRPGATTLGRTHTEHALDLATGVGDRLLVDEALDQLMAVAMAERQLAAAADLAIRRLDALEEVRIDATSSFEHYDARHMACHLMLATGQLVEARRYADAIAALPCFREQRHIGLGRRMEVDAVAGHFDAVLDAAVLFERDWRRAGSPIARNLAVGAYATAAVHSMLGDADGAQHWTSITRALVPAVEDFHPGLWRLTFDALVALHHADAATAMSLLQPPDELVAGTDPHRSLWLPWHVALWAEASVLTHRVDATERTAHARRWVLGNRLAELIIDRAEVLHNGRSERLDALATEFAERGCDYQSARTRELGTWERRT